MNKLLQYISLAAKAGFLFGGEMQTEARIRSRDAKVVVIAEDASDNTKKKLMNLAKRAGIPVVTAPDREMLGRAAGKDLRSSVVITDRGLAEAVIRCAGGTTHREGN